ncbi:MAG: hypothetical protein F6K47_44145 [Symploca sp. SIO2E6]|nr:hypothetical protein [Symploca sp. SIO2E6]
MTLTVAEGVIEDVKVRFFNSNDKAVNGRISVSTIMQNMVLIPGDIFNLKGADQSLQQIKNIELSEDFEIDDVHLSYKSHRSSNIEDLDYDFFDTTIITLDITEIPWLEKGRKIFEEADGIIEFQKAITVYPSP